MQATKKDITALPSGTGGGKGSNLVSPAHAGTAGIKSPGSKMNTKSMRSAGSKR
jgi:hypothetical protein